MRRFISDLTITHVILLIMIAMLTTTILLWERSTSTRDAEIDRLRGIIVELETADVREGGAETEPPPVQSVGSSAWTFPIAETDYLALTSPHGYRVSPILQVERYHQGVDIAATWKAQVVATADGVVVEHWPVPDGYYKGHPIYGGMLIIEHANGWRTLYAHLSETRVHTGWTVEAGQVIGRVGSTGQSRGAHLHLELMDSVGKRVNPLLYVSPDHATR